MESIEDTKPTTELIKLLLNMYNVKYENLSEPGKVLYSFYFYETNNIEELEKIIIQQNLPDNVQKLIVLSQNITYIELFKKYYSPDKIMNILFYSITNNLLKNVEYLIPKSEIKYNNMLIENLISHIIKNNLSKSIVCYFYNNMRFFMNKTIKKNAEEYII